MKRLGRLPAYGWVAAVFYALACFEIVYSREPALVRLLLLAAALILILFCVKIVKMKDGVRTAAVIEFLGVPVRSVGSGPALLFQPLGIPVERIAATHVLKETVIDDKMSCETEEEEVVPLDISIEHLPFVSGLLQMLKFTNGQLNSAIAQRVKSLLSIETRKKKKRDDVLSDLAGIAGRVEAEFNSRFADQYGVTIRFMIDDPGLPQKLVEKEIEREMQEKENERRELEVGKLQALAAALVQEAKKKDQQLSFEQAFKIIQVQLGIIKESRNTYGLDPGTLDVIKKVLPIILRREEKE